MSEQYADAKNETKTNGGLGKMKNKFMNNVRSFKSSFLEYDIFDSTMEKTVQLLGNIVRINNTWSENSNELGNDWLSWKNYSRDVQKILFTPKEYWEDKICTTTIPEKFRNVRNYCLDLRDGENPTSIELEFQTDLNKVWRLLEKYNIDELHNVGRQPVEYAIRYVNSKWIPNKKNLEARPRLQKPLNLWNKVSNTLLTFFRTDKKDWDKVICEGVTKGLSVFSYHCEQLRLKRQKQMERKNMPVNLVGKKFKDDINRLYHNAKTPLQGMFIRKYFGEYLSDKHKRVNQRYQEFLVHPKNSYLLNKRGLIIPRFMRKSVLLFKKYNVNNNRQVRNMFLYWKKLNRQEGCCFPHPKL